MRTELTKLHQRLQTTFIYVTHDQTEAMTMGSRIVVMKDGFIQQVDTPQNLYDYPTNLFVAGFIGSPQMNFINVTLVKEGEDVFAVFDGNKIKVPAGKIRKFKDQLTSEKRLSWVSDLKTSTMKKFSYKMLQTALLKHR